MEFDSVLNQATDAAKAQRASAKRRVKTGSMKITDLVAKAMAQDPEVEMPNVVRAVLLETGEDWSGVDAMTDDELGRLIAIGQRVQAVYRQAKKGGAR